MQFQLTRPVRVATVACAAACAASTVSTHATRAGRDAITGHGEKARLVSTHATRAGRDCRGQGGQGLWSFQLTRPVRVATAPTTAELNELRVSTHATRAGRDGRRWHTQNNRGCFNSRDPCGSRQPVASTPICTTLFQLTRPVRVATHMGAVIRRFAACFNSRDPCGSRLRRLARLRHRDVFQLTRPVRVATGSEA